MLKEAIASIEAQTFPVKEIIVVDYPDETYGNQARRLNYGVQKSTGTHYFFMGDDDILYPEFADTLLRHSDVDIVTSHYELFGDETGIVRPGHFPHCSTLVTREIYNRTQGYDEKIPIGIDADFYFQCFEAGAKWKIIEDVLYKSRVHKNQYSRTGDWSQYHPLIKQKYGGKYV